ncbi:hypothetical protein R3I93_019133 [Phoxinus phoxinus]|uniref:Uncharacterized protein n=1 Tax=Phoxinus phoxinus TaxID=58324 RepID=A0AAN9CH54_9TELE
MILVMLSALVVAGSKFEAIEGQNATISFDIDEVEKADEVKISYKEDKKEYSVLIAQKPWVYDDPPVPGVTLILGKGCVSVIIQNISISRSGLYKAEAYTREKVSEKHQFPPLYLLHTPPPAQTPPRSSDLRGHYALIPVIIIFIIIIIILCVCFWKKQDDPVF